MKPNRSALHVEVSGEADFLTNVGTFGRVMNLSFIELMTLIRNRNGAAIRLLEHRR